MRTTADKGEGGVKNWQNFAVVFYGWPFIVIVVVIVTSIHNNIYTVVSHIYAYDRAKTLSFILLIRLKSTEFENESNV